MRYYQLREEGDPRLAVEAAGSVYDLTAAKSRLQTFDDLLSAADIANRSVDALVDQLIEEANVRQIESVNDRAIESPLSSGEVWAAGVTYQISEKARKAESSMPDMYLEVYESDRPEVFFKATPNRTVGPDETVGIRADSDWDVPEPELGVVLSQDEIVGYTIGNDMSSRSIEGENPLYLPQAKVYDRCCSIGPCIISADAIDDPHELEMWMRISRDGEIRYDESTNTSKMVRSVEELTEYYVKHNAVSDVSVLLTGTSLVPGEEFTLQEGDVVEIGIEEIGTLTNTVVEV
ncbi:fumarylacetoacetate hydrolase family protein [Halostagnicola sp. A-GB9-2]|uniref:fumarylacetoacetate hydrolase family protein n=1 Tax=Halostagnicola sp. A-GB9-2 TaxID=3048066 RepID=UPI0024C0AADD|nr:fumarylacetoacetate hydrolase family protein [Halostagnicola sp. A-GB9-2]MDJ1433658.1 fumarylacetoacetate hydrolase family protein [Halostagnicola sp. A-GB9-2]